MSLIYSMLMSMNGYVEGEHPRFDFARVHGTGEYSEQRKPLKVLVIVS